MIEKVQQPYFPDDLIHDDEDYRKLTLTLKRGWNPNLSEDENLSLPLFVTISVISDESIAKDGLHKIYGANDTLYLEFELQKKGEFDRW